MFSSKKREPQQNAAEEAQKAILQSFEESLAAVDELEDPGEKLLKLEQIRDEIDVVAARTKADVSSRSRDKWLAHYLSISGGSVGTLGFLAFAHILAPPLIMLSVPACLAGVYLGSHRVAKEEKRLMQTSSDFFRALETQQAKAASLSETLVKTELPAISMSAKFEELLAILPSLRNECASAFSKQAAARKESSLP